MDIHVGMNQSWLTKPSGAVPVAKPTLIFLPRSPKVNHWKSILTCGFCSVYIFTRFWIHGRCCGFSKVQKLRLIGALPWANTDGARAAAATPRPAAPILRIMSRRVLVNPFFSALLSMMAPGEDDGTWFVDAFTS